MEQKYLPIGSVCTLKGKNKKIMITGYYSVEFNGNLRIKDYCGCVYPEGMLLPEQNCIFNHSDIESIDFVGFKNESFQTFKNLLNRLTGNETTQIEEAAQFHKENDMFLTSNSTYSKLLFDENGVVMIADRVSDESTSNEKKKWKDIQFSSDGTVVSAEKKEEIKNPFYRDFSLESRETREKTDDNNWSIFNKIEFDENGVVVDAQMNEQKHSTLNKIEFDENGVVISVNGQTLIEENNDYTQYKFDENGVLVADGDNRIEDHIPPVGPGLPGYEEPISSSKYKFDENGILVADGDNRIEDHIPPVGPGLPGYEEPKKEPKYSFDENGILISDGENTIEEQIPPIGPGLPGYVEPIKESKYKFDENGTVISE